MYILHGGLERKMNPASSDGALVLPTASDAERDGVPRGPFRNIATLGDPSTSETPDVAVRCPTQSDILELAALFSEMQRHYRRPVADKWAIEAATLACQTVGATFDPRTLVATAGKTIIGSIVLNVTFPAFELSRSLYIRDLYVALSRRRHGVGRALVLAAARLTYAQGFSALDWTTETDNTAARAMYESCGARVLSRTYYRLAREDMTAAP
jgi:ribosomal protein S18 acetylase RimI-like enzyme